MCGRYVQAKTTLQLAEALHATEVTGGAGEPGTEPSWNVAPTRTMPVLVQQREGEERQLRVMRWGLVPSWAKDPAIGNRLINARAETLVDKPSFRTAVSRRRCLIPADGWFEWMELEAGPDGKKRKQPFWFTRTDDTPLVFAGLFEHWRPQGKPDAPWLSSYTIITTTAVDELGHVHDRSPVPLEPEQWDAWLDRALTDGDAVARMAVRVLVPPRPGLIIARPVSTAVNSVRNDDPSLLDELPSEG